MSFADAFEALFLMADVDRDGRVSGTEAINFFRAAADLPQPTLAKVWEFACKGQAGFLTRQEFYIALKLATIAQTGRELTSELVKAASIGPAAAQIPPPRMLTEAIVAPRPHNSAKFLIDSPQAKTSTTTGEPQPHSMPLQANSNGQQYNFSPAQSGTAMPDLSYSQIHQHSASSTRRLSTSHDLIGNGAMRQNHKALQAAVDSDVVSFVGSDVPVKAGGTQFTWPGIAGPLNSCFNTEALHCIGEFSRPSSLVGDMASNCSPHLPLSASCSTDGPMGLSQTRTTNSSVILTSSNQAGISSCEYNGRQQLARAAAPPTLNSPWPKMTQSDVQRFVHVFRQVDTDHDGKVTGEQARQLFLSWQLPREVLRHVWNLSDEDGDSMLSVREFCTAVYLLERFTEGWPMPSSLPRGIHLDEPLNVIPVGKKGDLPLTDFVRVGQSSAQAVLDCALSSTSARLLLSPGEVLAGLERASCWPHNSQTLHENAQCMKQDRESEDQTLTPTVTEPDSLVPIKVADFTKLVLTQKEKAEYYHSKLQEIVHFKSQCVNKLAEMTEKVIVFKNEVNTLNQQYHEKLKSTSDVETEIAAQGSTVKYIQEKKRELSRALLKLDSDLSKAPESNLQTRFDHFAVDLHKLRKMLLNKAKSLGVEIKREFTTKAAFGWQPNIQKKAAEWKKGWGSTFNDEGFVEVEMSHINRTSAVSLVAISGTISPEEACAAAAACGNVEPGQNALDLEIVDCRLGHLNIPPAHEEQSGSVKESTGAAASSVSVTINSEASTKQSLKLPVSDDKPRPTINEFSAITDEFEVHSKFNQPSIAAVETSTRDAPHVIHPGIRMEAATETLTASGAKFCTRAKSISSEVNSSITSKALQGSETIQKMGQNDDKAGSSIRASWKLQSSNSRNRIQSPAKINASKRELRSRGSFEPDDYFDLCSPRDLMMPAPSSGGPATTFEHDKLEAFGFLAYTIKESSGSSPIFTTSTKPPCDTLVQTHPGHEKYPREELHVFDESGSDTASPSVLGK